MKTLGSGLVALLVAASPLAAAPGGETAFHFLLGKALAEEGRFAEGLEAIDRAMAAGDSDPYLRLERAAVLFQLGRVSEASREAAEARALAPDDPDVLKLLGRIELARIEEDPAAVVSAREALESLREQRPEDLETLLSLGQIYLGSGQPALAVEAIEEAARLRPNHPWIESLRARALGALGDAEAAERVQRDSLDRDPGDLPARLELVDRLGHQGRHAEAVALLEQAAPGQRARPEVRERLARELFLSGEPERARPVAAALVAASPELTSARLLLARIEITLGYFAEAERTLERLAAVSAAGVRETVADLRGRSLEGQGRVAEAAALVEARRTAALAGGDPEEAAARALELARLWSRHRGWSAAAAAGLEAAGAADPAVAAIGFRLASRALARDGRLEEALERIGPPAAATPERSLLRVELLLGAGRVEAASAESAALLESWPRAPLAVGGVLQDHDLYERALPLLERAAASAPESIEASFRLATCYERLGRFDEAVARFRSLLEAAPTFSPALNYLGYLWIERAQNLDEALRLVREAVRLEPDNGAYVDSLGWGEFQLGRFENAVGLLERAARLRPEDPTVHEHLGDARAASGDLRGAQQAYRRALDLGAGAPVELERKLSSLGGSR